MNSILLATGSYLPSNVVTNADLAQRLDTTDTWIREHIGVEERHFAAHGEGVSDMAREAATTALKRAQLKPADLDAIVFSTSTPEYTEPKSGALLQNKLGCRTIPAFNVDQTSAGFVHSLDMADAFIKSGRYRTVLVVASEALSTGLDFTPRGRKMAVIFGDGCGCAILRGEKTTKGFQDFVLKSDGSFFDKLWCESPSSLRHPRLSADDIVTGRIYPQMEGRFVFRSAVDFTATAIQELLTRNNLPLQSVDYFISHQANLRILEALQERFKLCDGKVPHNIERVGNTSSASIPILLDEMNTEGKIKPGQNLMLAAFGAGFCWGAGLLQM